MSAATRFSQSRSGNVAMMMGFLFVPLLLGAGIAIDTWRAGEMRARFTEAVDAGLLAAARQRSIDPAMTLGQAEALARQLFDENLRIGVTVDKFKLDFDPVTEIFTLDAQADMPTVILRVVGTRTIPLDTVARARFTPPRGLEVALVLDNTESMAGSKMTALKAAATDLVNQLMGAPGGDVKIGVVPFDQYVNVGLSRRSALWLDVDPDSSTTTLECHDTFPNRRQTGTQTQTREECTANRTETYSCLRDGVTETCTREVCSATQSIQEDVPVYDDGAPVEVCTPETKNLVWRGCVGSRDAPLDYEDRDYVGATRIPGLMGARCAVELLPLTDARLDVTTKIDEMTAKRDTYMPAGLVWGYRLLSANEPFSQGVAYADMVANDGVKALVFMTDGVNSLSSNYPWHTGSDTAAANGVTSQVCAEAKAQGITVYTIAFDVPDATTETLLRNCASDPDKFFDSANAAQLTAAFNRIANELSNLALTG